MSRLHLLQSHDVLNLLRNSISVPKLPYTLRTSECSDNRQLLKFDKLKRKCITDVININMNDIQWTQATLPVKNGGLGIRSVIVLAPSAFLASAADTLRIQKDILPVRLHIQVDSSKVRTVDAGKKLSASDVPTEAKQRKEKKWNDLVAKKIAKELLDNASGPLDQARLRAAAAPHSGDWLLAPPNTAVGLRMTNETIRISTGMRLGISICEPHICPCGKQVEGRGIHGVSCRHSAARISRHNMVNDIVWRAMQRVTIAAAKEQPDLLRSDNKRPDGVTLIPWKQGKCLAWDVKCLTPMRNHICQQQPRTPDTQQTSQPPPRLTSNGASYRHTCSRRMQ